MSGTNNQTLAALQRWSCKDTPLPSIDQIKAIHVYDFDNTLFSSPLPNRSLWNPTTCGHLQAQDFLYRGGWWHSPNILAAVGEGIEKEEPRAWEGWWNEKIVELVRLSMQDDQTLSVLLTGRQVEGFAELITRMVNAKGLNFDMMCLKLSVGPNGESFGSTMRYKQALLREIVSTYTSAKELRIYEDRPKHVKGFRDFFADLNQSLMSAASTDTFPPSRKPFVADVIHVNEKEITMDPAVEVAEVQKMINVNNMAILSGAAPTPSVPYKIKRTVFLTGYLIEPPDIARLRTLIDHAPDRPEQDLKLLANNIVITPRPAPRSILDKVGGLGAKMRWKVTGIAAHMQRVWAARVQPLDPGAKTYTENYSPCVVLATRRQAKPVEASYIQNWQPVPDHLAFEFETTVGEKAQLRIEQEYPHEDDYEASFPHAKNPRKHPREDGGTSLGAERQSNGRFPRGSYAGGAASELDALPWQNRGGGGGGGGAGPAAQRGGGPAAGRRGGPPRGRGQPAFPRRRGNDPRGGGSNRGRGRGGYRSLDDNVGQGYGSGGMQY